MKQLKSFIVPLVLLICLGFLTSGFNSCGDSNSEPEIKAQTETQAKQQEQKVQENQKQPYEQMQQEAAGNSSTSEDAQFGFVTGIIDNNQFGYNWACLYKDIKPVGSQPSGDFCIIWVDKAKNQVKYCVSAQKQEEANPLGQKIEIGFRPEAEEAFHYDSAVLEGGYYTRTGFASIRCRDLLEFCLRATSPVRYGKKQIVYSPHMWTIWIKDYKKNVASEVYPDCGEAWSRKFSDKLETKQ